jgi:hypothetical protein
MFHKLLRYENLGLVFLHLQGVHDVVRPKTSAGGSLPQVNPGNIELALQGIRSLSARQPVSIEWLEDFGVNQPRQVISMLRFLGLLDETDRLPSEVVLCRGEKEPFVDLLRRSAVDAYAQAGCGTRSSLGWFGRDELSRDEIRERIADKGPFADRDLKRGGAKNAFYALCALHEFLVDTQWLQDSSPRNEPELADTAKASPDGSRAGPSQEQAAAEVVETRVSDPAAAREFLREIIDANPQARGTPRGGEWLRVPFGFRQDGQPAAACVFFETPLRAGDLARLGRVLQSMAESMER